MRTTLEQVARRFDELLAVRIAQPTTLEAVLIEDDPAQAIVQFLSELDDPAEEILSVNMGLSKAHAKTFNAEAYEIELLGMLALRSQAVH